IDDVIVFRALEKEHVYSIIEIMVAELLKRARDMGINVELEKTAKDFLADKGFDPQFGARPLRRAIQKYIEDPMAESILGEGLGEGDTITLTYDEEKKAGELSFKIKKGK